MAFGSSGPSRKSDFVGFGILRQACNERLDSVSAITGASRNEAFINDRNLIGIL
jgi:hypothetical protein